MTAPQQAKQRKACVAVYSEVYCGHRVASKAHLRWPGGLRGCRIGRGYGDPETPGILDGGLQRQERHTVYVWAGTTAITMVRLRAGPVRVDGRHRGG